MFDIKTTLKCRCRNAQWTLSIALLLGTGAACCPAPAAEDNLTTLILQLQSASSEARVAAATEVGRRGKKAAAAVPALIEALKCERIEVLFPSPAIAGSRKRFAASLVQVGPAAVPHLEAAVKSPNSLVRIWAVHALFQIRRSRGEQLVPILVRSLGEGVEEASDAAAVLEQMGNAAQTAVPALVKALDHYDLTVRCNSAFALAAVLNKTMTKPLTTALKSERPLASIGAAFALQKIDPQRRDAALPVLAKHLSHPDDEVRQQAVWALGQLGPAAEPAIPDLIAALDQLEPDPRAYFFRSGLGRHGTDPALVLAAIGQAAKPAVVKALEDSKPRTRLLAAVALLNFRSKSPQESAQAVKALRAGQAIDDPAARMLARLVAPPPAPGQKGDIAALVKSLVESRGFGRSPADALLVRRGAEAVAPLMEVLKGGDGLAAARVARVLSRIPEAQPALTEALESEHAHVRLFATQAFAGMRERAIAQLTKALRDRSYPVRRVARYTLLSIDSPAARKALQSVQESQQQP